MASDIQTRILQAATELFAQQGYSATSMRAVAAAVGCTKPALYYHFGSKEDLFTAAVHKQMSLYEALLENILREQGALRSRLEAGLEGYFQHLRTNPAAMKLLMTVQHAPATDGAPVIDLLSMQHRHTDLVVAVLEDGVSRGEIRSGVDISLLSTSLIGLVDIWGMHCLFGQPVPENISDHILDIFFHGVAPA